MMEVMYRGGTYFPGGDLWIDPNRVRPRAVVSHAHADHFEPHGTIWCSEATRHLLKGRFGMETDRMHGLPWRAPAEVTPDMRITLLPAGHILGSAMVWIEGAGNTLLHTGDFKLRTGWTAEPCEPRKADLLVMETTYGLSHFQFPPVEMVSEAIVRFCHETFGEGSMPVLAGYSLGKAQEIVALLGEAGLRPVLHEAIHRMAKLCTHLHPEWPVPERWKAGALVREAVLVIPPTALRSRWLKMLGPTRTAMISGWGLLPGAAQRYRVDAVFPLSDHADFPDLCRMVELVAPRKVLTLHGYAKEFAAHLRREGVEAWALTGPNQLELELPGSVQVGPVRWESEMGELAVTDSAFGAFTRLVRQLGQIGRRQEKVAVLAEYLAAQPLDCLPWVVRWLSGRPVGRDEPLQIGAAVLRRAMLLVAGGSEGRWRELMRLHRESASAAVDFLRDKIEGHGRSLEDLRSLLEALGRDRGPLVKAERLAAWMRGCTPEEAGCLVRVLTGDLRVGLKEGLMEEALAKAFAVDAELVRSTHMIVGEVGEMAILVATGRLADAVPTLFRPMRVMLANPGADAAAVWDRLSGDGVGPVWAEPKYDGVRLQVHVGTGRVELFSRDLRRVSEQFPEVTKAFAGWEHAVILDGELVAEDREGVLSFQALQKRLGRKEADLFMPVESRLRFLAFDLLWVDGRSLLEHPLRERREQLERLPWGGLAGMVAVHRLDSMRALEICFANARSIGTEGLLCKDPGSCYTPGRRGWAWVKLKGVQPTLDVVVVAVEQGHGRRRDLLSDYTFAVRDEEEGRLVVIGKAYSGLTDAELAEWGERFRAAAVQERGRKIWVRPAVVLEVAFDRLQPSLRHDSGLAMRFPRIVRIREDKGVADVDTLATARAMVAPHNGKQ